MSESEQKEKKLVTFEITNELKSQVNEWCTKQGGMSFSQFVRTAITEKLNRQQIEPSQEVSPILDLGPVELAIQQLQANQMKIVKSLDYLIDRDQHKEAIQSGKIEEAKNLLVENQPKTYSEAANVIDDIDTMTEAINQLLQENKIQYNRKRFKWL